MFVLLTPPPPSFPPHPPFIVLVFIDVMLVSIEYRPRRIPSRREDSGHGIHNQAACTTPSFQPGQNQLFRQVSVNFLASPSQLFNKVTDNFFWQGTVNNFRQVIPNFFSQVLARILARSLPTILPGPSQLFSQVTVNYSARSQPTI